MTLSQLAEQIGTSIPTVKSRMEKLQGLGIIDRFSLVLDYELLSEHPSYFILVETHPNQLSEIVERILEFSEFLEVHELAATNQVLAKSLPISIKDLESVLKKLRTVDGINDIQALPLTHRMRLHKIFRD